jgi:hypothetical protein
MDFWRTVMVLFRRWYITVPAFVATLALAGLTYSTVPVQYQSVSVLVLTTPLSGGTETANAQHPNSLTNPMLNFDRSLALAAGIVIQQMSSAQTAQVLGVTPGGVISYKVTNGSSNPELLESGPFIFVQGTGPSAQAAQDITERASALTAQVLDQRQTALDAPPSTHITVQEVVPPTAGQPLLGSNMRAAAAVGALSGLASLAAVFGFESLMTHRRRRRAQRESRAGDDGPYSATAAEPGGAVSVTTGGASTRRSTSLVLLGSTTEDQ